MIEAFCAGCGGDCSNAYGVWMGEPYHIGCIPTGEQAKRRRAEILEAQARAEAAEARCERLAAVVRLVQRGSPLAQPHDLVKALAALRDEDMEETDNG